MSQVKKALSVEKPAAAEEMMVTAKTLSRAIMDAMANSPVVVLGPDGKETAVREVRIVAKKVVLVTGQ
jgi:hypothetical protein